MDAQNAPSDDSASKSNKTGVIVGVVVGVCGALILAALGIWFIRRHRDRKPTDKKAEVQPYDVSEKDLYRSASWAPHNNRDWPDSPMQHSATSDDGSPAPDVLLVRDGEEDIEYLPPRYREWQPALIDEAEPSVPASSSRSANATPETQSSPTTMGPSISLKEKYMRAMGTDPNTDGEGTSTATPAPSLKRDYARAFHLESGPSSSLGQCRGL